MTTVTESERELRRLETTIERGAQAFIEAGQALAEIRDRLLYRERGYATFEDYCRKRWQMSRHRAYELMGAAGVVANLSGNPDTALPHNASVATELVPLRDEPEAMREAWTEAVEQHGETPTAEQVRAIVRPTPDPLGLPESEPEPIDPARVDMRFELIEDAEAVLRMLPPPERIAWPTEEGDLEAVGEALAWLSHWLPRAKASLKAHKRELRNLRAVRS